jgi:hypothetical protein
LQETSPHKTAIYKILEEAESEIDFCKSPEKPYLIDEIIINTKLF